VPDLDRLLPLAYIGPGPGQEFIPYFFTLLGFVGAALVAVVQWPVAVLLRCLPRGRGAAARPGPQGPGDGSPDRP
jgi:hypothetical protein